MFDDTILLGIAVTDPATKLTDDLFLQQPYGIGIKQGNVALKRWVDSRLNLMKKRDLFLPILRNTVPPRQVPPFSKNILRPKQTLRLQPGRHHDGVLVAAHDVDERSGRARGRSFVLVSAVLAARVPLGRLVVRRARTPTSSWPGCERTLYVSAIAIAGAFVIGLVLGAARAHRVPGDQPARRGLRRGDPEHADPRPDLLPLLRAARRSGSASRRSPSHGSP